MSTAVFWCVCTASAVMLAVQQEPGIESIGSFQKSAGEPFRSSSSELQRPSPKGRKRSSTWMAMQRSTGMPPAMTAYSKLCMAHGIPATLRRMQCPTCRVTYCMLHAACYLLQATRYMLQARCFVLRNAYCMLRTTCSRFTALCNEILNAYSVLCSPYHCYQPHNDCCC